MLKRSYKCMKRLKNFNLKFDRIKIWSIHIKTKCITSVIGDSRWSKYHLNIIQSSPGYTYPPKILCAAFQMQYHKPNGLWTPKEWNNTRQIIGWLNEINEVTLHSVTTNCVPLFAAKMRIVIIIINIMKIIKVMKNNGLNENNKLIKYDLTTVDCTYNYTHCGKVSKYIICTTTICVIPISAKSYAFCAALPMVSQVTSMSAYHLVRYRVCYLPPTRKITKMNHW